MGAILNPGRVPEQELMSPELGFFVAEELRCVSGENLRCSRVLGQETLYRRRGDARRWTRALGGTPVQLTLDRGQVPPGGCGLLPDLSFWLPGSSSEIEFL